MCSGLRYNSNAVSTPGPTPPHTPPHPNKTQVTPHGVETLGVGPFMSLLAGICLLAVIFSLTLVVTSLRQAAAAAGAGAGAAAKAADGAASGGGGSELVSSGGGSAFSPASKLSLEPSPAAAANGGDHHMVVSNLTRLASPVSPGRRTSLEVALEGLGGVQAA